MGVCVYYFFIFTSRQRLLAHLAKEQNRGLFLHRDNLAIWKVYWCFFFFLLYKFRASIGSLPPLWKKKSGGGFSFFTKKKKEPGLKIIENFGFNSKRKLAFFNRQKPEMTEGLLSISFTNLKLIILFFELYFKITKKCVDLSQRQSLEHVPFFWAFFIHKLCGGIGAQQSETWAARQAPQSKKGFKNGNGKNKTPNNRPKLNNVFF